MYIYMHTLDMYREVKEVRKSPRKNLANKFWLTNFRSLATILLTFGFCFSFIQYNYTLLYLHAVWDPPN